MKKVLHLRSSAGKLGAESVIIEICKFSKQFSYNSIIGALHSFKNPYPEFLEEAVNNNIPYTLFSGKIAFDINLILQIRKFIKENSIDIVHSHGYKENFYALVSTMGLITKIIATNHLWKDRDFKEKTYKRFDQFVLGFFDKIIAVSSEIKIQMQNVGLKNIDIIDNGVDTNTYQPRTKDTVLMKQLNIPQHAKVIGMVSSLTPEKNHQIAIEAFKKIEDQKILLVIIGSGPLYDFLKHKVNNDDLSEKVLFLGNRSDIPQLLTIIDVFLLTSIKEGLPMALLEAMASGKVVVTTDVGEIGAVVRNKHNGLIIKQGDVENLTGRLLDAVTDKKLQTTLQENAVKTISNGYSSQIMTKQYCSAYDTLLSC
jgi:glycosyltransferase involved in cell wall biosynthesis